MVDYEKIYQEDPVACGSPFSEVVNFFEKLDKRPLNVLDLGCGQGRDALMIARLGHRVLGVDLSPTGIAQMLAVSQKENLNVAGQVANVVAFKPPEEYDVVILDRILHMLPTGNQKQALLKTASTATKLNGHILIADTPSNLPLIESYFESKVVWETVLRRKGFRFYKKIS